MLILVKPIINHVNMNDSIISTQRENMLKSFNHAEHVSIILNIYQHNMTLPY